MRFIYQGQFLCDKNTIRFYNIKDQTTIHCHITAKQQTTTRTTTAATASASADSQNLINEPNRLRSRPRYNTYVIASESSSENVSIAATGSTVVAGVGAEDLTQTDPTNSVNNASNTNNLNGSSGAINNGLYTVINIDLNSLLLPFFALILSLCWYFRVNFKHFFSPLSTLILVIFTFLYGLFLMNNIHSTSIVLAQNLLFGSNHFFQRRLQQQQQPSVNNVTTAEMD